MAGPIERDYARFKAIVRGAIRKNLKQYITQGELVGRQGRDTVKVPLPQIDIPRFRFGSQNQDGVGQGDGQPGDTLGEGQAGDQPGQGEAGDKPGDHTLETEVTLEELAEILGEELQLPRIEPKGQAKVMTTIDKFRGIQRVGPDSLRHFKRTYRAALKRQMSMGIYNPDDPVVAPVREDMRYRSYKKVFLPQTNALILYIMDVSGSMGQEQKDLVRLESFWIDTWLKHNYQGLDRRYIIHDAQAREVDEETFYHTRESGGTLISSAYTLALKLIEEEYAPDDWNIYVFQFSDGDNWSGDDTSLCISLLKEKLLRKVNLFGYGQVKSFFGSGRYITDLREHLAAEPSLVLSDIPDKDAILKSIKEFLGAGK